MTWSPALGDLQCWHWLHFPIHFHIRYLMDSFFIQSSKTLHEELCTICEVIPMNTWVLVIALFVRLVKVSVWGPSALKLHKSQAETLPPFGFEQGW